MCVCICGGIDIWRMVAMCTLWMYCKSVVASVISHCSLLACTHLHCCWLYQHSLLLYVVYDILLLIAYLLTAMYVDVS